MEKEKEKQKISTIKLNNDRFVFFFILYGAVWPEM